MVKYVLIIQPAWHLCRGHDPCARGCLGHTLARPAESPVQYIHLLTFSYQYSFTVEEVNFLDNSLTNSAEGLEFEGLESDLDTRSVVLWTIRTGSVTCP